MTAASPQGRSAESAELPTLIFLSQRTSGPSRRMESLVAWVRVTQKKRLHVIRVDTDRHPDVAESLGVATIPALVLLDGGEVVGKLEGRATGGEIDALIRPRLVG
jgi:thioredoxin-like negative regulator of GroEL